MTLVVGRWLLVVGLSGVLAACGGDSSAVTPSDGGAADVVVADGGVDVDADVEPWSARVERCGNQVDDDGDGVVDEDCPPSLWAGVFPAAANHLDAIEQATGRRLAVVQTYRSTVAAGIAKIGPDLDGIWARGSVPHLYIEPAGYTAQQYAAPASDPVDADLKSAAKAVADAMTAHPGKPLLFSFGAEMNGTWTDWGCTNVSVPAFIALYKHMWSALDAALGTSIDRRRLRWVYAPNSVSSGGCGSPADYYPGHAYTDYVGMSAYRSGTQTVDVAVIGPAKTMLSDLAYAPAWQKDRFIVLQTGSKTIAGDDRGAWMTDLYAKLTADDAFLGVIWFDSGDADKDWKLLSTDTPPIPAAGWASWTAAVAKLPPNDAALEGTFEPYFWDVHLDHAFYPEVQALRASGLTSGCSAAPPLFCPDAALTRRAAAVVVAGAFHLDVTAAPSTSFDDLPATDPAAGGVDALVRAGAIAGCGAKTFCPDDAITRADLAHALAVLAKKPADDPGDARAAMRGEAAAWIVHSARILPASRPR